MSDRLPKKTTFQNAEGDGFVRVKPVLLSQLKSPEDLKTMSVEDLEEVAREIRSEIFTLSEQRSIHFGSNLGVVELAIALHYSFDFSWDRLVWDVGHQCYPHKLLTGRFDRFNTLRTHGGLSGYPNPHESDYDLFMTGHAGCSVGTALGLALGDSLAAKLQESDSLKDSAQTGRERFSVAVVGDGSFTSGPVFEALNHAGDLQRKFIVILNDNEMSICPRVGGFGHYLDRIRMAPGYLGTKTRLHRYFENLPTAHNFLSRLKDALRTGLIGGAFFEDLGFHYIGPINGHDIPSLIEYLKAIKKLEGPVLLHVMTLKGHGYAPAESDPSHFHSSSPGKIRMQKKATRSSDAKTRETAKRALKREVCSKVEQTPDSEPIDEKIADNEKPFTYWAQTSIMRLMRENPRICVVVAAMTQGNMLENARREYPDRFFDVGISEAHAVNFAAGLAKAGMIPIVDIYSGFLQRAYDHIFQEASLQNLPIVFSLDRAGFVGADGATHHGVFDLSYLRPFPNMTILAPGDSADMEFAFDFAIRQKGPTAIRYPKTKAERIERIAVPYETGQSEVVRRGSDGAFLICGGGLLKTALDAADTLARGNVAGLPALDVSVVNARFVKPIDAGAVRATLGESLPTVSAEENALPGGFGSGVLEIANSEGYDARLLTRLGAPDYYIPHGSREEELAEAGLDLNGMLEAFRRSYARFVSLKK